MNGRDPVAVLLTTLDAPVEPRREFADALLAQLLDELRDGGAAPAAPESPRPGSRTRLRPPRSLRLRLALIALALLLLAAALAVAAYLGTQWLSAGPRGVQYSARFDLTLVVRTAPEPSFWTNWQLGPGGRDVYVLRQSRRGELPGRVMDLLRLPGVVAARGPVRPRRVWSSSELADPALWKPTVDVERSVFGPRLAAHFGLSVAQALAIASNGDMFVVAGAWREADGRDLGAAPLDTAVVVRRADGSTQRVLSLSDLRLPTREADVDLHLAASGPGRLWLMTWELRSGRAPVTGPHGPYSVFEVRDPDADGDWADRTVRRVHLPRSLPLHDRTSDGQQRTYMTQIVAEPPLRGQPSSFLLSALDREGRFRVHRVADVNGDGDARDRAEVTRVVDARPGFDDSIPPGIAARVVDGRREVVAAGLTRRTRLSIVSDGGRVSDVARAFEHLEHAPVAGSEGRVYAPAQIGRARGSQWLLYRLDPARPGRRAPAGAPRPAAPPAPAPLAGQGKGARIAFTIKSPDFRQGRVVLADAAGQGRPRRLVAGEHNDGFCQSADGRRMAYWSDEAVPHEPFVYVAGSDGSRPRKVTERQVTFWCGFSPRWLLLGSRTGPAHTLVRHDLRTGRQTSLVREVDRLALSPDGGRILFVGGLRFGGAQQPRGRETLEVLDLTTRRRRRLADPRPHGSFGSLSEGTALVWSRDGSQVAYSIGPSPYSIRAGRLGPGPQRYVIHVQPAAGGRARAVLTFRGGPPALRFSPDGRYLLVCLADRLDPRHDQIGCNGTQPRRQPTPAGRLVLVDLRGGAARTVARGRLPFADWSPTGRGLAYATDGGVFVVEDPARARSRRLAAAPAGGWPAGYWLGFSPDGRFIGLGDFARRVAVLDVGSGVMRVVARERRGQLFLYRKWWR